MSEVYLAHHGVKGQKWGIRLYQNTDGSLTEAGKKKYAHDEKASLKKTKRDAIKTANKVSKMAYKNYVLLDKAEKKYRKKPDDIERAKKIDEAYNKKISKIEAGNQKMLKYLKENYKDVGTSEQIINGNRIYHTRLQDKYGNIVLAYTTSDGPVTKTISIPASAAKQMAKLKREDREEVIRRSLGQI